MKRQSVLTQSSLKVVLVCDWTDEMISPDCCSALKAEAIVVWFHVKPRCLFMRLWLINVFSELTEGGHFVFYTHVSGFIMGTDQGEVCVIGVTAVCVSVSGGSVELPADGLLWHLLHSLLNNVATTTTLCPPKMLPVSSRCQTAH